MRQPNARLAEARQRKVSHLPQIARLSLAGETTRETAAPVGPSQTSIIRWPESLRRDCPTKAVAQSVEIIDELIDGYKTVYRKALEGWDRSLADKEIRTVVDCPMDDAKNRRSVRTETRAGNPACLNQARGALDSIRKLLGLDAPAQVKIEEEEEEAPIDFTVLQQEDLRGMSDEELAALAKSVGDRLRAEAAGADEPAAVHGVHQAGLPDELAPPEAGGEAGPGGGGPLPAADGVPPPAAREERTGEPPLPGVSARPESGTAAHRLLPH